MYGRRRIVKACWGVVYIFSSTEEFRVKGKKKTKNKHHARRKAVKKRIMRKHK